MFFNINDIDMIYKELVRCKKWNSPDELLRLITVITEKTGNVGIRYAPYYSFIVMYILDWVV